MTDLSRIRYRGLADKVMGGAGEDLKRRQQKNNTRVGQLLNGVQAAAAG